MTWPYAFTPYMLPMLASAACLAALAGYAWHRRSVPGARPLALMMLFALFWAIGAAFEVAATHVAAREFWIEFQAIWQLPVVTALFCFSLEYANLGHWLTRRTLLLLAIPPLVDILLVFTNDLHHGLWLNTASDGSFQPVYGLLLWLLIAYGYALNFSSMLVLIWLYVRSPLHRWPVGLILLGRILTSVAFALDITQRNPVAPMDPTILAATFSAAMYSLALFRFRLFDVVPLARNTIIEWMADGILVLDAEHHIADLNSAAQQLLGVARDRAIGLATSQVLSAFPDLLELSRAAATAHIEMTLKSDGAFRCYQVSNSPLIDRRGHQLGQVLTLHNITEVKQVQERLLQQQRLLATLQERDRVARELHDSLGQVLGYVKMQAQAARGLLARDLQEEADRYLAQLVTVAQEAHADVRAYILEARSDIVAEAGFCFALTQYLRRFSEIYGLATELTVAADVVDDTLEPMVAVQLLRIIQEALTNARKHAGAQHVQVNLSQTANTLTASVQDDGAGFDPVSLEADSGQTFGLSVMRERAAEIGGSVRIVSAPGAGTQVVICVPLRKETP
jgi:PAS domain S-box-containing protein